VSESTTNMLRTPRISLIVALPDNCDLLPDAIAERIPAQDAESVDIILACAGSEPRNIAPVAKRASSLQILVAPSGTSGEDLRELAMSRAAGDIISFIPGVVRRADARLPIS
jgi:hypothetical protein